MTPPHSHFGPPCAARLRPPAPRPTPPFPILLLLLLSSLGPISPLRAGIAYTPADPSTLTPQSLQWETDYQERLSDMVNAQTWSVGAGNADTDDGKRTWPALLAEMWKVRTNNASLTGCITGTGASLMNSTWAGSFYKPFTCPGYNGYYFRFRNYNSNVSLTSGQLTKASTMVGTTISGNSHQSGLSGWTYMTRADGYMDPIINLSEFNSENFNWMSHLSSVQWAYEKPDLDLGNQSRTGTPIPSSWAWADNYLDNWTRGLIGTGRVEWNSNNYWSYTFNPVTVLYDFPPGTLNGTTDPALANRTRLQARAGADWMVLENALHYVDGFRGGPDTRAKAGAHLSFAAETWPWMYLHFATDEGDPAHPSFARSAVTSRSSGMINQIGFLAWAGYRPLQVAIDIAQRKFALPVEILSAKPHYDFDDDSYANWDGSNAWNTGTWSANPTTPSMADYQTRFEFETLWMDTNYSMSSAATFRPDTGTFHSGQSGFFTEQNLWRIMVQGPPGKAIERITMNTQGGGYNTAPAVTISAPDLPGGVQATATANLSAGKINNLVITSNGSGYSTAPTITIPPPTVTQAVGTATVSANQVQSIAVTNGGAGYANAPSVTVAAPVSTQAAGTAVLGTGGNATSVVSVTLNNPGAGYRTATVAFSGGGGTGATGNVSVANGVVTAINIANKGSGYTSPPTVTVSAPNPITAVANATVTNGTITAFGVSNKGGGYTAVPTVTVGAPNPSNATATAVLTGGAIQFAGNTNADSDHNGRDPWENIGQFANVMIRAVRRSTSNGLWIIAPKVSTREYAGNILFSDTGSNVYVAFIPRTTGNITLSNASYDSEAHKYSWTFDNDALGFLVTEVGTAAQHGNFTNFKTNIQANLATRLTIPSADTVQYVATPQGSNRTTKLQWMKPWTGDPGEPVHTLADGSVWGNSTTRAAGVVPRLWRDGVEVDYSTWDAYKVVQGEEIVRQAWGGDRLLMMANGTGTEIRVDPVTANVTYYAATQTIGGPTVTASAPDNAAAEQALQPGTLRLTRDGSTAAPLVVQVAVSGTASPTDRNLSPVVTTNATILAGSASLDITVTPTSDALAEGNETVVLTIQPGGPYDIAPPSNATVTIADLPIDDWRFGYFGPGSPAGSGDAEDFDRDGRNTLLEYGLDTNPLLFSTGNPVVAEQGGNLTLTYSRPLDRTDLDYQVRLRTDLPGTPLQIPDTQISSNATHETRRATTPIDDPRKFLELQILRLP
jgi:hypothetical protein